MSSTLGSPSLLAGSERGREAVDPVQGLQGLCRAGHTDKAKDRYSTNSRYFFCKTVYSVSELWVLKITQKHLHTFNKLLIPGMD